MKMLSQAHSPRDRWRSSHAAQDCKSSTWIHLSFQTKM